jgi:outer membrane protein
MQARNIVAAFLLALVTAAPAAAQEDPVIAPENKAAAAETRWRVSVGAGVISAPKFPGSDTQRTLALPFVGASLSYGRFFIGGDPAAGSAGGIGMRLYTDRRWRLALGLSADLGHRKESDDPRLTGLGDVDRTASAFVAGSYTYAWLTTRLRVATDVLGHDQGTLARLDMMARHRSGDRWIVFAGPGVTWADRRYTQTFFGVDADQSARSGLPQFQAGAGWNSTRVSFGANYRIDARWNVGGFASLARLQGDAADSPITEDRWQRSIGVFLTYRFGNAPAFGDPGGPI